MEHGRLNDQRRLFVGDDEIAICYFRAGYAPTDYPTEKEWEARLLIEQSFAIKCPNAAYHLIGSKKVQQVLALPGVLEKFLNNIHHVEQIRGCFTGLYPMDQSPEGLAAYDMALKQPERFVLKPQREGGGNNFYKQEVREQLEKLSAKERNAYILMDLIAPPAYKNTLVRRGVDVMADVVSELGIYGIWLSKNDIVYLNEEAGHLLRTKSSDSNEGGVASGFAVLDSPMLV